MHTHHAARAGYRRDDECRNKRANYVRTEWIQLIYSRKQGGMWFDFSLKFLIDLLWCLNSTHASNFTSTSQNIREHQMEWINHWRNETKNTRICNNCTIYIWIIITLRECACVRRLFDVINERRKVYISSFVLFHRICNWIKRNVIYTNWMVHLIDMKWREIQRTTGKCERVLVRCTYICLLNLQHAHQNYMYVNCTMTANAINQMPTVKCSRKSNKSHWEMKSPLQQNDEYIYKNNLYKYKYKS